MLKTRVRRYAIILGMAALCAMPVSAQQCRDGKGPGCEKQMKGEGPQRMWDELGLSEEQKGKLKGFHEKQMTVRAASFEKMKAVRTQIGDELAKDAPDRKVLASYSAELGEMARMGSEQRIDHMLEMRTILTKEQYQKFIAIQKKRGPGPEGMGEGHGPQGEGGKGPGCRGCDGKHHEGKK